MFLRQSQSFATAILPGDPLPLNVVTEAISSGLSTWQIFCTEPFRVPVAGKVDVCLFDKTGTLTTDELVAVGVTNLKPRPAATNATATGQTP